MPLLATWLGALFAQFAVFLTTWMAKKTALAVAAVATFVALTVALFTAVSSLVGGLSLVAPSVPGLSTALWLVVPDNFAACMSVALATDTACALYLWNSASLKLAASVT